MYLKWVFYMIYDYNKLLKPIRFFESTIPGRTPIEEFYSDYSRIVFSSSFRRL